MDRRSVGRRKLTVAEKAVGRARAKEELRQRRLLAFEFEAWESGCQFVAGVDEAGMAPLAGPVCAGAAIIPIDFRLTGLKDSKAISNEAHRDELAMEVKRTAIAWAVGWASPREIDSLNIYQAGLLAMRRAVEALTVVPDFILIDARDVPGLPAPHKSIIRGDALSLAIAAGAILAKTHRDAAMRALDVEHPGYGFAAHKGYPTQQHKAALDALGVLDAHRRSFAPVRAVIFRQSPLDFEGTSP